MLGGNLAAANSSTTPISNDMFAIMKSALPSVKAWWELATPTRTVICNTITIPSQPFNPRKVHDVYRMAKKLDITDLNVLSQLTRYFNEKKDGNWLYKPPNRGLKQPFFNAWIAELILVVFILAQVRRDRINKNGSVCRGLQDDFAEINCFSDGLTGKAAKIALAIIVHPNEERSNLLAMRKRYGLNKPPFHVFYFLGSTKLVDAAVYENEPSDDDDMD
jgi:hypothetical protein